MKSTQLIIKAQQHLVTKPFDMVHDIIHHSRVYSNCVRITQAENIRDINFDALIVAAWWHDAEGRTGDTLNAINEAMDTFNTPRDFKSKVLGIIQEHSFGKNQTSLESQILFDADKIEYVSLERFETYFRAYKDGYMDKDNFDTTKDVWYSRIDKVRDMMFFDYSKQEFDKLYKKSKFYFENNSIF